MSNQDPAFEAFEAWRDKMYPCLTGGEERLARRAWQAATAAETAVFNDKRVRALAEAATLLVPPLHGEHGGPLVRMVAYYEDGTEHEMGSQPAKMQADALAPFEKEREDERS